MKKIILLSVFALLIIPAADARQHKNKAALKIQSADQENISITVDGKAYNEQSDEITIRDIAPGKHTVKVLFQADDEPRSARDKRHTTTKTFSVTVKPGLLTTAEVASDGSAVAIDTEAYEEGNNREEKEMPEEKARPGKDRDDEDKPAAGNRKNSRDSYTPATPLTAKDITFIKQRIQKKSGDNDRLETMEEEIGERPYKTEQIRTMLHWLKSESTRLRFAEWAYDGVIDTENYKKLATEFKLPASKKSFNNIISRK